MTYAMKKIDCFKTNQHLVNSTFEIYAATWICVNFVNLMYVYAKCYFREQLFLQFWTSAEIREFISRFFLCFHYYK